MPAKHETVGEETEQNRLGKVHNCLSVDCESLSAEVELETGQELGLKMHRRNRCLRHLRYRRSCTLQMRHGGREVAVDEVNGGLGNMMDVACPWPGWESSSHDRKSRGY